MIVNHFKSKGSGATTAPARARQRRTAIAQANALVTFADEFAACAVSSRSS